MLVSYSSVEKMDFQCFKCFNTFSSANETIKHLKKDHFICENTDPIKCIANNKCTKEYLTFGGLRNHIKKCIPGNQANVSKHVIFIYIDWNIFFYYTKFY